MKDTSETCDMCLYGSDVGVYQVSTKGQGGQLVPRCRNKHVANPLDDWAAWKYALCQTRTTQGPVRDSHQWQRSEVLMDDDLRFVRFETINGNPVFINPECVVAVHLYRIGDSEINLANGIDVQVRMTPGMVAAALLGLDETVT